jgi:alpha-L-fucosidase
LLATNARIYGPKLVYETKYKNLGWWQSADDAAEWSLQIPAAGKYRVTLDYACEASAAGDTLQLAIGGQTVLFKVPSTGTWDDYVEKAIGIIELDAGPAEASVRSNGAIRSALIDLRGIKLEPAK